MPLFGAVFSHGSQNRRTCFSVLYKEEMFRCADLCHFFLYFIKYNYAFPTASDAIPRMTVKAVLVQLNPM